MPRRIELVGVDEHTRARRVEPGAEHHEHRLLQGRLVLHGEGPAAAHDELVVARRARHGQLADARQDLLALGDGVEEDRARPRSGRRTRP
jgi:hypothetical protein